MWILLLILIGVIVYLAMRAHKQGLQTRGKDGESALDILKKRYAGGEISREEYERMRRELE